MTYKNIGASMPKGVEARFYDACESTNLLARELATEAPSHPIWIVAGTQTSGRGRQGRKWVSESGNLYASLLFRPRLKPADLAALPFVISLAVRDSILRMGVEEGLVKCKWPNDILVSGKKVSGILIETCSEGSEDVGHVIVGIGINLLHHPQEAQFPATNLKTVSSKVTPPEQAISILASSVKEQLDAWRIDDFETIRQNWQACAWGLGEKHRIRTSESDYEAQLLGLNTQGGLEVSLENGEKRTIYAADIFPGLG